MDPELGKFKAGFGSGIYHSRSTTLARTVGWLAAEGLYHLARISVAAGRRSTEEVKLR